MTDQNPPVPSVPDWDSSGADVTTADNDDNVLTSTDDSDALYGVTDPHEVDEDPENNIGPEIQDPWLDATELAWVDTDADDSDDEEQD